MRVTPAVTMRSITLEDEATFVEVFNEATNCDHKYGGYPNEQYRHYMLWGSEHMANKWSSEKLTGVEEKVNVWARMLEIVDHMNYEEQEELARIKFQLFLNRHTIVNTYKPYQNPNCTQPPTYVDESGCKVTEYTIEDTCDDVDCCYCHGCEYEDEAEDGTPVCVVCGGYYE
mgnify:CR=1 FL=1